MLFNIDINFDFERSVLDYWDNDDFEECCSFSDTLQSKELKDKLISKLKIQNKKIKLNKRKNIIQKKIIKNQ